MDRRKFSMLTPGLTPNAHQAPLTVDTPQLGTVTRTSAAGVWFTSPAVAPGFEFGPCPWCVGSYASLAAAFAGGFAPQAGDTVLVAFPGIGVDAPVVSAWWR